MGYNLLITGVYWGYNPLTNHLLSSWDIQVYLQGGPKHQWKLEFFTPISEVFYSNFPILHIPQIFYKVGPKTSL